MEFYTFSKIENWGHYIYNVIADTPREAMDFIIEHGTIAVERKDLTFRMRLNTNETKGIKFIYEHDIDN